MREKNIAVQMFEANDGSLWPTAEMCRIYENGGDPTQQGNEKPKEARKLPRSEWTLEEIMAHDG